MLDKDKIKNSLTLQDITNLAMNLGSDAPIVDSKGNLIFTTICHCGTKHKLYYYNTTKYFRCYTECDSSFDVFELTTKVKQHSDPTWDFSKSLRFVAQNCFKWFTMDMPEEQYNENDWLKRYNQKIDAHKFELASLSAYSNNAFNACINLPNGLWYEEGISHATMKKYNIQYHLNSNKIVIPHYDINNRLIGIRGRALNEFELDLGYKYMPIYINNIEHTHNLSLNLYGINHTQEAIRKTKSAIIVEAEKSVLKCEDYLQEHNNCVACCGSTLSTYQRDLLLYLGVNKIFLAFDKEYKSEQTLEAMTYRQKLMKVAQMFLVKGIDVFVLWDTDSANKLHYKESPCDKDKATFLHLLQTASYIQLAC